MIGSKTIREIFSNKFINSCKNRLGLNTDIDFELRRISKLGRKRGGKSNLIFPGFQFIDNESFINQYLEIFSNNIFYFKTDTSNPLIIDCGSNIGVSISYFKFFFPKSKIIGFEPDPEIFKVLNNNISHFSEPSIELHNSAVWIEDTILSFVPDGSDGGYLDESGEVKVQAKELSAFLNQKVDFLKIDIEGAEAIVLQSISDQLHNVRCLFIELHVHENNPTIIEETFAFLRKRNFKFTFDSVGKASFKSLNDFNNYTMQINIFAKNESV